MDIRKLFFKVPQRARLGGMCDICVLKLYINLLIVVRFYIILINYDQHDGITEDIKIG